MIWAILRIVYLVIALLELGDLIRHLLKRWRR